ncbi:MAG: DUF885 domain-containing protein [Hyphomonadaceae bacterium]|nr:DUF885 domain-containing protein [Hyphomonadaceae bacterium]
MIRLTALSVVLFLVACGPKAPAPTDAFDGFVADATRDLVADSPELATRAGLSADIAGAGFAARLDDRSREAVERRRATALRLDAQMRGFDAAEMTPEQAVTHAVLTRQFADAAGGARFSYGRFDIEGFSPYVLNQLDSAFLTLPDFLDARHRIDSLRDAVDYVARLRAAADAIDAETERARADAAAGVIPPDFVIDRTLAALDAMNAAPPAAWTYVTALQRKLEALTGPLAPPPPDAKTPPAPPSQDVVRARALLAQAERIVATQILPAHLRAAAFLRSVRPRAVHDAGVMRLPDGAAFYAAALAQQTTTALQPDRIHALGLERVAALTAELDGALRAQALTEGTPGARLAALTADPLFQYPDSDEGRAQLLADVEARIARVMTVAVNQFGVLPKAKLEVRRVPVPLEAAQSGAYYEAPSLDGTQPGVYYINLRSLAEMTKIDLPTQDYHEGAPGHHFQIALAQEQDGLPLIRRLTGATAYAEGWGLYAEQVADEMGLYETDPIGRIGYLRWQLWRAARLVVDTGLHAKGWSREEAIAYLIAVTGDAPGVAASEVERYAVWPGQACSYEIGRLEIERLREKARRALGTKFELKGFHDVVLLNGAVPLPVLETLVDGWIAREGRGKK